MESGLQEPIRGRNKLRLEEQHEKRTRITGRGQQEADSGGGRRIDVRQMDANGKTRKNNISKTKCKAICFGLSDVSPFSNCPTSHDVFLTGLEMKMDI